MKNEPTASIIATGNELLQGDTPETNSLYISSVLERRGIETIRKLIVGDEKDILTKAISVEITCSDIIIITGGLGPTADDITVRCLAGALDIPLRIDESTESKIREKYARTGRDPSPEALEMAKIPEGFEVLENPVGTAPGLYGRVEETMFVLLPGVSEEMKKIMETRVLEKLPLCESRIYKRCVMVTGLYESRINDLIPVDNLDRKVDVGITINPGVGKITLKTRGTKKEADRILKEGVEKISEALGDNVYARKEAGLEEITVELLKEKGLAISTAESCTGGLLGKRLTSIPGSSKIFPGGVISYSNQSKIRDLGISKQLIKKHGAVSRKTARAMSEAVRKRFKTNFGTGITGIAGPSGGTKQKPVGTVYISLATKDGNMVEKKRFPGGREEIRFRSTQKALDMIRRRVLEID